MITTKRRRISQTSLVTMIRKKNWYSVHMFLNEARILGINKTFALHQVCCDPEAPLEVVKEVYYAHPKAALEKDVFGETPIFVAVNSEFECAVEFLARVCPEASAIRDTSGSTPLHSAISTLDCNSMINSIINNYSKVPFIADDDGDSAFDCFFRHWNVFLRAYMHDTTISHTILHNFIGCGNWKIGDIYHHTFLFLEAASSYRRGKSLGDAHLLHCAFQEETCPSIFCKLLLKLHPEQVLSRDSNGKLPIHLIAAAKDESDEKSFLCFDCYEKKTKLFNIYFIDGKTKYCCEDCLKFESATSISESFQITPGK